MKKIFAFLLMLPLISISFSLSAAPKTGQQFKDWVTVCQTVPNTKKQHCHIAQTASDRKTNKPVLHTMVGRLVGQNTPVAIFIIPKLISPKTKLQLLFDQGFSISFNVQACDKKAKTCHAGVPLDKRIIQAFKKGKVAHFTFKEGKKEQKIPISLLGVTAGLNSLPKK